MSQPNLKPERRYKAVIVLKQGPKYIVVQNKNSRNLTFPGGGCHSTNSVRTENKFNCALRELMEETHKSIQGNLTHLPNIGFNNTTRSRRELINNSEKKVKVTMQYNIFKANIKKNFNKIKRNFHNKSKYPSTQKGYKETNNIFLVNEDTLLSGTRRNKKTGKPTSLMWNFMKNKVLYKLVSRIPLGRQSLGKW